MDNEHKYISCCGRYYCALCDYHKGTIVDAAKRLLAFAEKYGSLEVMAKEYKAYNFDEFMKGLRWLASHEKPCRGCRFGGGWSWWPDCPVRDCCVEKGVDFCYQCKDFPCRKLREEPLLDYKKSFIEANRQIKAVGIEKWVAVLKERYSKTVKT